MTWARWCQSKTASGKAVMRWVREGYSFQFTAPAVAPDDRRGTTAARVQAVGQLLGGCLTPAALRQAVQSPLPPSFCLPNHTSVAEHRSFVEGELLACLRSGAISIAQAGEAHCVSGMGVVIGRASCV